MRVTKAVTQYESTRPSRRTRRKKRFALDQRKFASMRLRGSWEGTRLHMKTYGLGVLFQQSAAKVGLAVPRPLTKKYNRFGFYHKYEDLDFTPERITEEFWRRGQLNRMFQLTTSAKFRANNGFLLEDRSTLESILRPILGGLDNFRDS